MNLGYHKIIMDIQKFLDIQKCILGYPQIDFWISIIHFWISKIVFLCIFGYPKMNYGYPKIESHAEFWISIIRFLDIQKSVYFRIS